MGSRTSFGPPVYLVPPPQYHYHYQDSYRTPVSPVSPVSPDNMAPPSAATDAGPPQRKLIQRRSTLSLHLSSFLHHSTKEKGIQEPNVVQLPPTPDSETAATIVSSEDNTDRESSGISTANTSVAGSRSSSIRSKTTDNNNKWKTPERRKSRLSMLIPSFFSSDADQQGTGTSVSAVKLHKQKRPVTANPLLSGAPVTAANYANPGAQQATTSAKSTIIRPSTSVNNSNVYSNPAANYSSPDGLGTTNSSPQTKLRHKVRASTMPLENFTSPAIRPGTGSRSVSAEGPPSGAAIPPNRLQKQTQQQEQQQAPRNSSPTSSSAGHSRGPSTSSQPPAAAAAAAAHHRTPSAEPPRIVSTSVDSRPTSTHSNGSDDSGPTTQKHKQRRSWFGGRSRSNSEINKGDSNAAWIVAPDSKADYNTANLLNGEKVPELWNESGNLFIYLHPPASGRGPSFKVLDYLVSSSQLLLSEITWFNNPRKASAAGSLLTIDEATNRRPVPPPSAYGANPNDGHLYIPLENTNLDSLVAARNLFALLTSQPIVATKNHPTLFATLLQVAALLKHLGFRNHDGSTFGEQVDGAFNSFLDQFAVSDVRGSREKTIQAIILGEHMRSWTLYNEAFTHAVGKYESIQDLKLPMYNNISVSTRNRLERAYLDLTTRQANANLTLESFEFPSLFAGIGSSTSSEEAKHVNFKEWHKSFGKMRTFVLSYYKDQFGNWPPKARSKKNQFSQSGLNRQCLKTLYSDCCALYDLLVDRECITPRVIDQKFDDGVAEAEAEAEREKAKKANELEYELFLMRSALRTMLSEFDRSSPPVLPPIPFDCPKIPSMTAIHENYRELDAKKRAKLDRKLASNELMLMLIKSRNIDTDALQLPFLQAFKEFEHKEAKGANPSDIANQRIGYWLFLYVVLQSLPMLVVDTPGLHWTEGVEYFLCEAPQGNPPWMEDAGEVRKMWYQTNNGQGIVELSADVVMFSVEGIYMRSHCWLAAKEWEAALLPPSAQAAINHPLDAAAAATMGQGITPLEPPRAMFQDNDPFSAGHQRSGSRPQSSYVGTPGSEPASPLLRPRTGSPAGRGVPTYRSSIAIGLEPLDFSQFGPSGPSSPQEAEFMLSLAPGGGLDRNPRVFSTPANIPGRSNSSSSGFQLQHGHRASSVGSAQTLSALSNLSVADNGYDGRSSAPPAAYRDPSRGSIVSMNGQPVQQQQQQYPGSPGVSPSPLGRGESPPRRQSPPSQQEMAQPTMAAAPPSTGGSTFDDILKGMDNQKKKKKGLFF